LDGIADTERRCRLDRRHDVALRARAHEPSRRGVVADHAWMLGIGAGDLERRFDDAKVVGVLGPRPQRPRDRPLLTACKLSEVTLNPSVEAVLDEVAVRAAGVDV